MAKRDRRGIRHLVVVLGDQLDARSAAFDGFEPEADAVCMMEVEHEASWVPQHQQKLVLFFSAMRHFRDALREKGVPVRYAELDERTTRKRFADEVARQIRAARPESLVVVQPGDHRVEQEIRGAARELDCPLEVRPDRHFLCSRDAFREWAEGRKSLLMEAFYRRMRKEHGVLVGEDGEPAGGEWNYDAENRDAFGPDGPGRIKAPRRFRHDDTTREVVELVARRFADAPGEAGDFDGPVTREQARAALRDFVEHRLPRFGRYQDAMAAGRPYLYHSRLSTALNLHLLHPRDAIDAVVEAWEEGEAPLPAVEGFVRQVLGWREFVRGVYHWQMPGYAERNELGADRPVPAFLWSGETDMRCVRECVTQLREHAYAHHIQRLMVLGLFQLLLGARPYDVHRWHVSLHADALDWVSLPNVLGMSQYADGGLLATKPYCASGAYIDRMSDYCGDCRYDPRKATGDDACPFTTLYWDFLSRHRQKLEANHRMGFQIRNLDRKSDADRRAIRKRAHALADDFTRETFL